VAGDRQAKRLRLSGRADKCGSGRWPVPAPADRTEIEVGAAGQSSGAVGPDVIVASIARMKTIVTGGAGFIGSHLVDRILALGGEVVVVDNFDPFYERTTKEANLRDALANPRCRLIELDIRDAPAVDALVQRLRPDVIVHLAARAGVRPSIAQPRLYADVNVTGTVVWLEAACRIEPKPRFIYASSSSVYGDRSDGPFRETDPVDLPVSPYAATKKACELLAHTFHHLHGLPVTGLRFFTAFGPRNRPDLAIAKFTRLIDHGEPVPMFGNGSTRRDYTYVGDIVDGVLSAIERCHHHHLYNLGHSLPIALREMIDTIAEGLGKPPVIEPLSEQPGDVQQTFASIERARTELGYDPKTPFRDGIGKYIAWYRSR
jgi:UDP-glucuronate 4-epimerase